MATNSREESLPSSSESLALARTRLANVRTMLAYTRTAIMLAASGATLLKFYGSTASLVMTAWGLVAAAVGVGAFGVARYQKLARALN
jgi:putative membrane protein